MFDFKYQINLKRFDFKEVENRYLTMSKNTQNIIANGMAVLPIQYSVLLKELDTLFNKNISNGPSDNVYKKDLVALVHTLYEIDRADYNKGIVRGTQSFANDYQIPQFLKFIILPSEVTIDGFPLQRDIIKRYPALETEVLSVPEWDNVINRIRFVAKRAKLSIDVESTSTIDSLRPSLDGLSKVFVNAISKDSVRDIKQDSLFETIDAIDIDRIDDTAFISVELYVKGKLNLF